MKMVLWFEQKGAANAPKGLMASLKDACPMDLKSSKMYVIQ
jgi:hypothetical protein